MGMRANSLKLSFIHLTDADVLKVGIKILFIV